MAAGQTIDIESWLNSATQILNSSWGLDSAFAKLVAKFYLYLNAYGLQPAITSGFRNPEHQAELLRRWESGDASILVRPATNSKHCNMRLGRPAALAIDISTNNHQVAARIANALGIGAGYFFKNPDGVHFYV